MVCRQLLSRAIVEAFYEGAAKGAGASGINCLKKEPKGGKLSALYPPFRFNGRCASRLLPARPSAKARAQ